MEMYLNKKVGPDCSAEADELLQQQALVLVVLHEVLQAGECGAGLPQYGHRQHRRQAGRPHPAHNVLQSTC